MWNNATNVLTRAIALALMRLERESKMYFVLMRKHVCHGLHAHVCQKPLNPPKSSRMLTVATPAATALTILVTAATSIDLLAPYRSDMLATGCEGTGQAVDARHGPSGWQVRGGPLTGWRDVPASRVVADWENRSGFPLAWFDGDRLTCFAPAGGTA
jgi:hypothetical protein